MIHCYRMNLCYFMFGMLLQAVLVFIDTAEIQCVSSRLPTLNVGVESNMNDLTNILDASDIRLKRNIKLIGKSPSGIPTYTFKYQEGIKLTNNYVLDSKSTFVGAMAQDLLELAPDAVGFSKEDGYYRVDYSKIDVDFYKL